MDIFLGAAIGSMVGFVLALHAIIFESMRRQKNLPVLVYVKEIFGKRLTHEELFVVSLFLHLILATLAGGIYTMFAEQGWLFITNAPYALHSILIFTVFAWVVTGGLIFSALHFGFFWGFFGRYVWVLVFIF